MRNVTIKRTASLLTITVDLTVTGEVSKSGKSIVLASSEGNQKLVPDAADSAPIFVGINVYKTR